MELRLADGHLISGRYRISRFIGAGGMGEVYEAEDVELSGSVALKIIRPDLLEDPHALTRFRREIQLARQVTHPNVCRVFDVGRDAYAGHGFQLSRLAGERPARRFASAAEETTGMGAHPRCALPFRQRDHAAKGASAQSNR